MDPSSSNVGTVVASPVPLPLSTNNNETTISQFQRLSLNTASATASPLSPQVASPQRTVGQRSYAASPNGKRPLRSPHPRSSSSMSLDAHSSTPTLLRKASMSSIHSVGGVTPPRASSSRRASSAQFINGQTAPGMGKSPLSGIDDAPSVPLPPTATSIASAHFKTELDLQTKDVEGRPAETIVILQDACYGHRYSRPRTSRAGLSTIVERPERIHASILGLSVAYVRLGQRHAEGRYPPHPKKDASNIPSIPFRIRKTSRKLALSSPAVTNVHGMKWMEELKLMCDGAEAKLAVNGKELTRPEMSRSPDQGAPPKLHEGDLYLCSESLNAMEGALGAVCEGVDAVFMGSANGKGPHRAFVAIRPPGHHCSASYPSGFCWLNNVHVGIAHAALNCGLTHAAIIDFDLHHGDGSQAIAWEHNTRALSLPKNAPSWKRASIGYFSLHDINSYPCEMGDEEKVKNASLCIENAHGQSIWNVHLQPWKSEHEFWDLYETRYSVLLEKTRGFLRTQTQRLRSLPNQPQPKAAIFLSAGFDASEWESSGMQRHKVNVPTEFYARLTRDVVKLAAEEGCAVDGRIISVLEGGYSDRALSSGVLSHISGLAGGDPMAIEETGLGYEMAQKVGAFSDKTEAPRGSAAQPSQPYDATWWALPQLEHLDALVNPPPPPEPRKPRDNTPPTYSSPTQSFTAKISTPRLHRSASNISSLNGGSPRPISRAPSPPPPEVYWATAAHELSKLLIPSDRQTMSCKPEELSAEATRARRDRQSILAPAAPASGTTDGATAVRMSLRERKAAKPLSTAEEMEEADKPTSKASRRKTVAGGAVLAAEKAMARSTTPKPEPSYKQPTKQSTRRLSLVSSTGSVTSQAPSRQASNSHRVPSTGPKPGPTTISERPGSSQSVRPGSSMSSRGHTIPPVVVKKTRTANPTRPEASKNSRTNRKPLAVDKDKYGLGVDGTQELPPLPRKLSSSQATNETGNRTDPFGPAGNIATADMDSITTGMKKIKINLTTKAQREAKEQAKLAVKSTSSTAPQKTAAEPASNLEKQLTAQLLPLNPQPSFEDSKLPDTLISQSTAQYPSHAPSPSTPKPLAASRFAHLQDASSVPLPASSPPVPGMAHAYSPAPKTAPIPHSSSMNNVFVPYQPEGPAPASIPQQEPLKWLPPNTSTPAAVKRNDLPVFTSTSAIPFGVNTSAIATSELMHDTGVMEGIKAQAVKQEKTAPSIWDVPETPGR